MSTVHATNVDANALAPLVHGDERGRHPHVVQFYKEDAFLLDELSRIIGEALEGGNAAVVVATKPHRDGLEQRLKAKGLDLASCGRYFPLDASEILARIMLDEWPDAERFVAVIGGIMERAASASNGARPGVVAFGEMVALLWAQARPQAAIRLEQLWNDLAKIHSFSLRCAYPMSGFHREEHGEAFSRICTEHSGVIPDETYTVLADEEERLRSITQLQQKAQALSSEAAERKEVQKHLQRRESELAEILENAVEGVQQVGPDQRILWANRALLNLLGYSAQEYVNHPLAEFHLRRHVFDEFWAKLMRGEDIYDYAADLKCKDGSVKHVLTHSSGLWEDGRFVHTRCFVRDVTQQKQMEQALRQSEARLRLATADLESLVEQRTVTLRQLSSRLLSLQDSERRRIARELHDSTGQYLVALKLNIEMLRKSPGREELWSESESLMERCISEVRTLSYLLHPPTMDTVGLASAVRWYVDGFSQRSGLKLTLDAPDDLTRLPDTIELALFRVLQEALTNVHRHSGASSAEVLILRSPRKVVLEVRDNGRGIPNELLASFRKTGVGLGVGLISIHERARELGGKLQLRSNRRGTSVRITIPPPPDRQADSPVTQQMTEWVRRREPQSVRPGD